MKIQNVLHKIIWFAICAALMFAVYSMNAADSEVITFQEENAAPSDNSSALVGHWRKTTIGYVGPKDEHLVLQADGTAENWTVTAESRSEPVTGHWSVEGKTLTLSFGDNENSQPFTFYEGQLVFPNIPNRRGIWERID